jgi:hypothetical protein
VSRLIAIALLAGAVCCACEGSTPKPSKHDAPALREAEPPPPAWFDAAKIPHEAVIMQMAPEPTVYSSAMILELEAGVSNQQCIERARAALGESLSELPEVIADGSKLLIMEGATDDYNYTVMCTEVKGKPTTMHLSYSDRALERELVNRSARRDP